VVSVDAVTDDEVARLRRELERLRSENHRLSRLLDLRGQDTTPAPEQLAAMATQGPVTMASPVPEKLAFYASLFRTRRDAYAKRWENHRLGTAGWSPAVAGGWRRGMDRRTAAYLPLTAEVVTAHLVGDVFMGLIPAELYELLRDVVGALSQGMAISIAPHNTMLTTQEAADLLNISRPTLVRLLTDGEIPHSLRGRHRRVLLRDILDYSERTRTERRRALDQMAADAEDDDLYEITLDSPPSR
jgi:excisionase family DNA binding protein